MRLINAVRNGKQVTVMLELKARFDEEANLKWKERLEEEGVKSADWHSEHEGACKALRDPQTRG
jgi:hypothetical protein